MLKRNIGPFIPSCPNLLPCKHHGHIIEKLMCPQGGSIDSTQREKGMIESDSLLHVQHVTLIFLQKAPNVCLTEAVWRFIDAHGLFLPRSGWLFCSVFWLHEEKSSSTIPRDPLRVGFWCPLDSSCPPPLCSHTSVYEWIDEDFTPATYFSCDNWN